MVEVGGAIAETNLGYEPNLLGHLLFEGIDVDVLYALQFMPPHVEDGSCTEFGRHESLVELQ